MSPRTCWDAKTNGCKMRWECYGLRQASKSKNMLGSSRGALRFWNPSRRILRILALCLPTLLQNSADRRERESGETSKQQLKPKVNSLTQYQSLGSPRDLPNNSTFLWPDTFKTSPVLFNPHKNSGKQVYY